MEGAEMTDQIAGQNFRMWRCKVCRIRECRTYKCVKAVRQVWLESQSNRKL